MVILIMGASHTGKTALAQKLLSKYGYPYLSVDHLKMGLIRSGNTELTPTDDDKLTEYLWPITREIIKTVVENNQNLIIEGCYFPPSWQKDLPREHLRNIKHTVIVMSENYIRTNFDAIKQHARVIENRLFDDVDINVLLNDNAAWLSACEKYNLNITLIDNKYAPDFTI